MNEAPVLDRKLFKVFADNPALMAVTSMPERKYVEINKAFTAQLGYTREDILGKTVFEMGLMTAADIAILIDAVGKTGSVSGLELQVKAKDGSLHTLLFSGNVIKEGGSHYFLMVSVDITEQRRLQRSFAEQSRKLESVIDGTGLGTWEYNLLTGEAAFSGHWAGMLGYTPEELGPAGVDTWKRLTHPDDLTQALELLRKYINREIPAYVLNYRMRHKKGHWVWIACRGIITERDDEGRPLKMFGTHLDITAQKAAAEALKESEQRFHLALEGAEIGLWDWDLINGTIYFSPKLKSMLGYTDDEIPNTSAAWRALRHPDDLPAVRKAIAEHLAGRTDRLEITHRLRHKNGQWRWLLTRGSAIVGPDGVPRRWVGTDIDVTDEKNSREELERFFSVNLDLLCIADFDGNFLKINKAWTDILGYSVEELEKRKFLEYVHPEDLDATLRAMERLAASEQVLNFVNRYRTRDGAYRYIEWRSRPFGNQVYAAARDITERIEYEERIREISLRDPLTNAYNRKYIFEQLESILAEYKRTGRVFSITLLDIDFFKNINDQHGHQAGDFILKEFTTLLRSNLRPYDLLGRYGGEEFIVVSPNTWTGQARSVIKRILDKVRNTSFIYNGTPIGFTFSAGISDCFECGSDANSAEKTIEMIVEKADSRLYKAKRTGRDKIVPYRAASGRSSTTSH